MRWGSIATEDLIGMLANLDEAPWADYNFRQRDPEERRAIHSRR